MADYGRRPGGFIFLEHLETLMKHDARVFVKAYQSRLGNKMLWRYLHIFCMLPASFLLRKKVTIQVLNFSLSLFFSAIALARFRRGKSADKEAAKLMESVAPKSTG